MGEKMCSIFKDVYSMKGGLTSCCVKENVVYWCFLNLEKLSPTFEPSNKNVCSWIDYRYMLNVKINGCLSS